MGDENLSERLAELEKTIATHGLSWTGQKQLGEVARQFEARCERMQEVVKAAEVVVECWEASGDDVTGARELRKKLDALDTDTTAGEPEGSSGD